MNSYQKLNLYPHNIRTCEKVSNAFNNGEDIVSIIKATGTGKSYIGLNLALEHKDEKIVSGLQTPHGSYLAKTPLQIRSLSRI